MKNKRLFLLPVAVVAILLIPFLAMQVTGEVNWTLFDFVVMGILLLGTGLLGELILRTAKTKNLRIGLLVALVAGLLMVWAELAVGVFGTPLAGS